MEPAPLLPGELDEQSVSRPDEVTPPMGLDISADDMEAPYLRLRTFTDDATIATPTPSLADLTHLVVTVPEIPQQARRKALQARPRGDGYGSGEGEGAPDLVDVLVELGDAGGGLTAERLAKSRSRVSLSRPWLVGLGMLAFAAGLLTAAGARVVATPVRSGVAAATASANPSTNASANVNANAAPAEVPAAPVLVAAANVDPPVAEPPLEAREPIAPAAVPAVVAAPAPKTTATGAGSGKARAKAAGSPSARGRSRSSSRARLEAKSAGRSDARDDSETATAPAEAKAVAAPHRAANWVDPFAE